MPLPEATERRVRVGRGHAACLLVHAEQLLLPAQEGKLAIRARAIRVEQLLERPQEAAATLHVVLVLSKGGEEANVMCDFSGGLFLLNPASIVRPSVIGTVMSPWRSRGARPRPEYQNSKCSANTPNSSEPSLECLCQPRLRSGH